MSILYYVDVCMWYLAVSGERERMFPARVHGDAAHEYVREVRVGART